MPLMAALGQAVGSLGWLRSSLHGPPCMPYEHIRAVPHSLETGIGSLQVNNAHSAQFCASNPVRVGAA
jgi:hypothetical protein